MKKSRRIIVISLIISLIAFLGFAAGQQETDAPAGPPQGDRQSGRPEMERPSEAELTLMKLQYFVENAEAEPELAITVEQAQFILPILEDLSTAVDAGEDVDAEAVAADINEILTEEQCSFLPRPERPEMGADGERPENGERPEPPVKPSVSELLAGLTEALSEMI